MASILLADDERIVRDGLRALLAEAGHVVWTARDGDEAVRKFDARRPDLVILDVMMPRADGFAACRGIRSLDRRVPVLFLTAKDGEADQVRGLGLGADDYIPKATGDEVLLARVRRALDRAEAFDAPETGLALGRVRVDLEALTVTDGKSRVELTRTEGDILRLLAARRGACLSRKELVEALRGRGFACGRCMLYVHMHNLRRKLGAAADCLVSDRYAGYRLVLP